MKIPDKIYISIERTYGASDGQVIAMVTPHNERQSVNDVEYIRKDALMEWIEEYRNILSESLKSKHSPVTAGKMYVLIKLLDKLNSI